MKKLVLLAIVSVTILGCKPKQQPAEPTNTKENDAKALYEKNLATIKGAIAAFEKEDLNSWASYVADSVVYISAAYGATEGTKEDWRKTLAFFIADWDSLKLQGPIFLPGLDSVNHEIDGSVRFYGQWNGVHKSGVKTASNYYATYEFNADNKIVFSADFFDVGGLLYAVTPKK